jgi:hypothetical protein
VPPARDDAASAELLDKLNGTFKLGREGHRSRRLDAIEQIVRVKGNGLKHVRRYRATSRRVEIRALEMDAQYLRPGYRSSAGFLQLLDDLPHIIASHTGDSREKSGDAGLGEAFLKAGDLFRSCFDEVYPERTVGVQIDESRRDIVPVGFDHDAVPCFAAPDNIFDHAILDNEIVIVGYALFQKEFTAGDDQSVVVARHL